jgi:hypothetical protein
VALVLAVQVAATLVTQVVWPRHAGLPSVTAP